jgi:uncharacterized Zn finger protein
VDAPGEGPTASALGAAVLFCEGCGQETPHRIVRLDRTAAGRAPKTLAGVARCRVCRWTHPFVSQVPARVRIELVVSRGASSERRWLGLDPASLLRVDATLAGEGEAIRVRGLDRRDGARVPSALARETRTVWAVEAGPRLLRVAVLAGARSTTERVAARPGLRLGVGDRLALPSGPVTVVALRARQRTWRKPGDAFDASEVQVVYGRRTERPPAGRSPWSRDRGTPSSAAISSSRAARSRSSPGVSRRRTVPRARTADAGATARNSWRS